MARSPSASQFAEALRALPLPGGRQLRFLRAHYSAPGKAMTAAGLAKAARYENWSGVNLRYGLLAKRIGEALGREGARLNLLVEFAAPKSVTNQQWVLVMRAEFAEGLRRSGWIDKS